MGRPFIPAAPNSCSLASGNLRKRRSHIARNSVFQKLRHQIFLQIYLQCMEFNSCISIIYSGHFNTWCPGLHQKSGRSSVVVGWFLKCQRAGRLEGGADAGIRCLLLLCNQPKKGVLLWNFTEKLLSFSLFSCTCISKRISSRSVNNF